MNELDLMLFTAQELVWLHRLMNSDDPEKREFAWVYYKHREAQREKQRLTGSGSVNTAQRA